MVGGRVRAVACRDARDLKRGLACGGRAARPVLAGEWRRSRERSSSVTGIKPRTPELSGYAAERAENTRALYEFFGRIRIL